MVGSMALTSARPSIKDGVCMDLNNRKTLSNHGHKVSLPLRRSLKAHSSGSMLESCSWTTLPRKEESKCVVIIRQPYQIYVVAGNTINSAGLTCSMSTSGISSKTTMTGRTNTVLMRIMPAM